nr:ribonuclease H-like domain-containing protein [Tanacetum cinerariifolium]
MQFSGFYTVQRVCIHMHDPREPHLSAFKRILRLDWVSHYSEINFRSIVVLLMLLMRPVGYAIYCVSYILLYLPSRLSDNVSAVYLSYNPVQHQHTKHIEIDIHFVRDLVATGLVCVLDVPSRYQFADIFTKGLSSALFEEFRTSLSIWCPPAPTAGEC